MASVSVRYIVDDVDAAIEFYCGRLGFAEVMHPAPAFAMLQHGELRLVLSAPGGGPGGGQAMPDGSIPKPGGGTGSRSRSTTSRPPSTGCAARALASATRSSMAWADGRSWSRTRQATRWSCLSRPCQKLGWAPPLRPSPGRPGTRPSCRGPRRRPSIHGGGRSCPGPFRPRPRPPAPARRSGPARRSTVRRSARGRPAPAAAPGSDPRGSAGRFMRSPMARRSTGRPRRAPLAASGGRRGSSCRGRRGWC